MAEEQNSVVPQKKWQNCLYCGGERFIFDKEENTIACKFCGRMSPDIPNQPLNIPRKCENGKCTLGKPIRDIRNLIHPLLKEKEEKETNPPKGVKAEEYHYIFRTHNSNNNNKDIFLYYDKTVKIEERKVYQIRVNFYSPDSPLPKIKLSNKLEGSSVHCFPEVYNLGVDWQSLIKNLCEKYGCPWLYLPETKARRFEKNPWYLWEDEKTFLKVVLNKKDKQKIQFSNSKGEKEIFLEHQDCYFFICDVKEQKEIWRLNDWDQDNNFINKTSTRKCVEERDGSLCHRCHDKGSKENPLQLHHLFPKECGGLNVIGNLRLLCKACHKAVSPIMGKEMDKE